MKPSAYFINVGRGELVDQQALTQRFAIARSRGPASTCSKLSRLPIDDPLIGLDNVILTPHWSASTSGRLARDRAGDGSRDDQRAASGQVPENVVNPEVLDRPLFAKTREIRRGSTRGQPSLRLMQARSIAHVGRRSHMKSWGFIGAGKMATALVHGMLRAGIAPATAIFASDPLAAARTLVQLKPASLSSNPISTSSSTATCWSWR